MVKKPLLVGVAVLSIMAITGIAYADSVSPRASSSNFLLVASAPPVDISRDSAASGSRLDLGLRTISLYKSKSLTPASATSKDAGIRVDGLKGSTFSLEEDDCEDGEFAIEHEDEPCDPPASGNGVVPEPFSLTLLGTGLIGLAAALRKRTKGSAN